jgi:hypothetical protein
MVAVDEGTIAGDRTTQHRLRESPVNRYIHSDAGDAGGILPDVATVDRPSGGPPIC